MNEHREIHAIELKEYVLHQRLCKLFSVDIPYILAVTEGKVDMGADLVSYNKVSHTQCLISMAKINYKHLLRVYAARHSPYRISVDLNINLSTTIGSRVSMISSMPAYHASVLERAYLDSIGAADKTDSILSEAFDPYLYWHRRIKSVMESVA